MTSNKKLILKLTLILYLFLLVGCSPAFLRFKVPTLKDITLVNKSPYVLIVGETKHRQNGEIHYFYKKILIDDKYLLNVDIPQKESQKIISNYSNFDNIYVFKEELSSEIINKNYLTENEFQKLIDVSNPTKIYSRSELEAIVMKNPSQNFLLECFIDNSLTVYCEPTIYPIESYKKKRMKVYD